MIALLLSLMLFQGHPAPKPCPQATTPDAPVPPACSEGQTLNAQCVGACQAWYQGEIMELQTRYCNRMDSLVSDYQGAMNQAATTLNDQVGDCFDIYHPEPGNPPAGFTDCVNQALTNYSNSCSHLLSGLTSQVFALDQWFEGAQTSAGGSFGDCASQCCQ